MDDFVKLKPEERSIFFEETAMTRNMQALIVEKDFWVCWTLKELFGLPEIGEHLIFKGALIRREVATTAITKPELLARGAQHKSLFFRTSWARYEEAARGTLHIRPPRIPLESAAGRLHADATDVLRRVAGIR